MGAALVTAAKVAINVLGAVVAAVVFVVSRIVFNALVLEGIITAPSLIYSAFFIELGIGVIAGAVVAIPLGKLLNKYTLHNASS